MPHLLQQINLRSPPLPILPSSPTIITINTICSHSFPPNAASRCRRWATARVVAHPSITCMANPRRVKMVAKQIRRELSDMLLTDKVLQYAVLPEAALGADRYLSSLTTVSDVEVSGDLQVSFLIWVFDEIKCLYVYVIKSLFVYVFISSAFSSHLDGWLSVF